MAQVDWNFLNVGSGFLGGGPAAAQVNAALANPLTGEGTFCRVYDYNGGGAGRVLTTLDAAVDAGAYVGIPATKSVSLRAWAYIDSLTGNDVFLSAKTGNNSDYFSGYHFGWGGNTLGGFPVPSNTLWFRAVAPNGTTGVGGGVLTLTSTQVAAFAAPSPALNWLKLRMDILPIGPDNDEIRLYTGTGVTGAEVWTLKHTVLINASSPYFVYNSHLTSNKYGYGISNGNQTTAQCYIDRFQIFLEDV